MKKLKEAIIEWVKRSIEHSTPPEQVGNYRLETWGGHGTKDGFYVEYDLNGTTKKFHVKLEVTEV
jgi:hypothetical protein